MGFDDTILELHAFEHVAVGNARGRKQHVALREFVGRVLAVKI